MSLLNQEAVCLEALALSRALIKHCLSLVGQLLEQR
jgi:hypothetical protein